MRRVSYLAVLSSLALATASTATLAADLVVDYVEAVEPATSSASGFVSVGTGYFNTDFDYIDIDSWAIELAASGVYQFTPEVGVQGDLVYSSLSTDETYFSDVTSFDGALHLFFRDSSSFLIGGFVQVGTTDADYDYYSYGTTRSYVGVEGQLYLDLLTLYGQVGWQNYDEDGAEGDGLFANVEARYFITDDFRVDVHAGMATISYDFGDTKLYNVGIGAEYKFTDLPLSVFGKLDYYSADQPFLSTDSVRAMVGLKFNFGDDTLFDRDRNGPTLKPVEAPQIVGGGVT